MCYIPRYMEIMQGLQTVLQVGFSSIPDTMHISIETNCLTSDVISNVWIVIPQTQSVVGLKQISSRIRTLNNVMYKESYWWNKLKSILYIHWQFWNEGIKLGIFVQRVQMIKRFMKLSSFSNFMGLKSPQKGRSL